MKGERLCSVVPAGSLLYSRELSLQACSQGQGMLCRCALLTGGCPWSRCSPGAAATAASGVELAAAPEGDICPAVARAEEQEAAA